MDRKSPLEPVWGARGWFAELGEDHLDPGGLDDDARLTDHHRIQVDRRSPGELDVARRVDPEVDRAQIQLDGHGLAVAIQELLVLSVHELDASEELARESETKSDATQVQGVAADSESQARVDRQRAADFSDYQGQRVDTGNTELELSDEDHG